MESTISNICMHNKYSKKTIKQVQVKHPYKFHRIKKPHKKQITDSKISDSQSTFFQQNIEQTTKFHSNLKIITTKVTSSLLKDIVTRAHFGIDTYLAALKLLHKIHNFTQIKLTKLVAGGIISIVGKIYEFRTPNFKDLIKWSKNQFNGNDILRIQGQILNALNFEIPFVNNFEDYDALHHQVVGLEFQLKDVENIIKTY